MSRPELIRSIFNLRNLLFVTLGFLVGHLSDGRLFAQTNAECASCKPPKKYSFELSGTYNVCAMETLYTSGEWTGITAGINYWNNYFSSSDVNNIRFVINGPGDCDINMFPDMDLSVDADPPGDPTTIAEFHGTATGHGATVNINPDHLKNFGNPEHSSNYWAWAIAEEFGHLLGYGHVETAQGFPRPECHASSVMVQGQPDNPSSLSGPLCGDRKAITERYQGDEEQSGGEVLEPTEGDCFIHWQVVDHYIWANGWVYTGSELFFMGITCEDPLPE